MIKQSTKQEHWLHIDEAIIHCIVIANTFEEVQSEGVSASLDSNTNWVSQIPGEQAQCNLSKPTDD